MPFAPAILSEYVDEVYINCKSKYTAEFMTLCYDTKPEWLSKIPAVVHEVDGTSRPQIVKKDCNPHFHNLISEYMKLSNIPIVLNTSFNAHGEPINNYPHQVMKHLLDNSIRWINIHEALGDNICAFNLLESLKRDNNLSVSTAYPFLYELSGDVKLSHNLIELCGLGFNVYEHGSENHSKTLESAYFSMNGEEELYKNRRWKYFYNPDDVIKIREEYKDKKIVLLAPSASNREGPSNGLMLSNKTWEFKRWEQIVEHLQKSGYYVVQVGVKEDFKVSNVNEYFFNRSFSELVALIITSKFFLGLDTFFQHLCGLMGKKGIVVTPAHNDHAFWDSTTYIVGKVAENFENLKWLKDHLNPFRAACMKSISVESVKSEVDKIIDSFNKY